MMCPSIALPSKPTRPSAHAQEPANQTDGKENLTVRSLLFRDHARPAPGGACGPRLMRSPFSHRHAGMGRTSSQGIEVSHAG